MIIQILPPSHAFNFQNPDPDQMKILKDYIISGYGDIISEDHPISLERDAQGNLLIHA